MRAALAFVALLACPVAAVAGPLTDAAIGTFTNIDGGTHALADWAGRPVLVVNTASFCGYTYQYADLQALYETYRDAGLIVLAVPSNDFNQEYGSNGEVAEFCELTYGIDLPMTEISVVTGAEAIAFYRQLHAMTGWQPQWNFNKVLLDGQGNVVGHWGSGTRPVAAEITGPIEAILNGS